MTKIKDMHEKWMRDDDYRREYAALEVEFAPLKGLAARPTEALDCATIEAIAKAEVPAEFDQLDRPTED
jgi:hypothetical protein